jgi:RNA polymerase primary sigma factor
VIQSAILRGIARQARIIRLPERVLNTLGRLAAVESALVMKMGRDPTLDELARAMPWPDRWSRSRATPEQVAALKYANMLSPVSLVARIGVEDDRDWSDLVEDRTTSSAYEQCEGALTREVLQRGLSHLSEDEREVIRLRYGDGGSALTLRETGEALGISRERVRQIEEYALGRLRIIVYAHIGPDPRLLGPASGR